MELYILNMDLGGKNSMKLPVNLKELFWKMKVLNMNVKKKNVREIIMKKKEFFKN